MQTELTRRRLAGSHRSRPRRSDDAPLAHVKAQTKITIGVGNWAVESMTEVLQTLEFTEQTGIEVEVLTRPGTPNEFITQMAGAIQAGNSPYDVIDFEDEIASTFSRAGWLLGLDDLLAPDFWDDFPPAMVEMADVWDKYNGETFRIHHNYEASYWWYRKDIFDEKGLAVPTTWDEVRRWVRLSPMRARESGPRAMVWPRARSSTSTSPGSPDRPAAIRSRPTMPIAKDCSTSTT